VYNTLRLHKRFTQLHSSQSTQTCDQQSETVHLQITYYQITHCDTVNYSFRGMKWEEHATD